MKKIISLFIAILVTFNSTNFSLADTNKLTPQDINAKSAILIDAKTGEILFEKNKHKKMYPASTTKILTGILAIEMGNFDEIITVDDKTPYEIEGTHIALEPGEKLSFKDLVNSMLIESANDSAVVIAKNLSGSVENFADLMNKKAKELGAKNSNFVNPNGLPNEEHVTTAYDLAMIAKYAMKNNVFRNIVKNYTYTIPPTNKKSEERYMKSANRLLYSTSNINVDGNIVDIKYDGAIGIKTGYTVAANQCLVAGAKRNGKELISVILSSDGKNKWVDTHKLFNYGFNNFSTETIAFKKEFVKNIEVEHGDKNFVTGIIDNNIYATIPNNSQNDINKNIILSDKVKAPISKGQVLGKIEYSIDGKIIGMANIISTEEINMKPVYKAVSNSGFNVILDKWWIIFIVLFVIWRYSVAIKRKRRKRRKSKLNLTYKGKY
mgnify:CR=1 FL=1